VSSNPPQLFIIAGPNGAGKSTTSKKLLHPFKITAFDWDKEFYDKWSKFGFDPIIEQGIRDSTNDLFSQKKNESLKHGRHFAFETNFHQGAIFSIIQEFKSAGFEVNLYYLLISSVTICKARVEERVKVDHGHPVSEQTIEERFSNGLDHLNQSVNQVDRVYLYDASFEYDLKPIAVIEGGQLTQKEADIPTVLKTHLSEIVKILKD
jgi:predicted ABC-type ATPase